MRTTTSEPDDGAEGAKREVAQRMAQAFASMQDGTADAAEVRASLKASRKPRSHVEVGEVVDRTITGPADYPDLPVRIYQPLRAADPTPVIVYLHGGGFVLCDLDSHDACCRRLANGTGAVVISVDYRLAPEHPFPAAVDDAWAATVWASEHAAELGADPSLLVVAGDSAGGNMSAVVSMLARDNGGPAIAHQVLIYPVVDQRRKTAAATQRGESARGVLSGDHMRWFTEQYLGVDGDRTDIRASPILGDLAGLPPAHVVTAERDPLCDEGELYAQRLRQAGVPATIKRYPGMFHGFFNLPDDLPLAEQANTDVCAVLRAAFDTSDL